LAAARAGAGVAVFPDFLVAGVHDLVALDLGGPPLEREVWLVVHRDLRTAPTVRVVIDCIREAFREA
jgi:DNA-binding transcriptional LysR family regulator